MCALSVASNAPPGRKSPKTNLFPALLFRETHIFDLRCQGRSVSSPVWNAPHLPRPRVRSYIIPGVVKVRLFVSDLRSARATPAGRGY